MCGILIFLDRKVLIPKKIKFWSSENETRKDFEKDSDESTNTNLNNNKNQMELINFLKNRGPDYCNSFEFDTLNACVVEEKNSSSTKNKLKMFASVLQVKLIFI